MLPDRAAAPARAVLFDAYGTLFDVYSVAQRLEHQYPGSGERLSVVWRDKQIEYTRLVSMSGQSRSFRECTRAGLRFAVARFGLALTDGDRRRPAGRLRPALALSPRTAACSRRCASAASAPAC